MPNVATAYSRALVLACLLVPATAGAQMTADPGGRALYLSACVNCHGADGRGAPQSQVGFPEALPDFADCAFASREATQDWEAIVTKGGPARRFSRRMPAFGQALTRDEIVRVVSYLRTLCTSPHWPRGELNLPRSMVTEKAFPEDEAVFTASYVGRRGERALEATAIYERRVGSRGQLEFALPFLLRELPPPQGGSARSWHGPEVGDFAVAFKRTVLHRADRGILSLGGEVALPLGDYETGAGASTIIVEPFVLGGLILPANSFFQFQGGVGLPFNPKIAEREGFIRMALGTTLELPGRALSPIIEVEGVRGLASSSVMEWSAIPQVQLTLSRRRHISLGLGLRVMLSDLGQPPPPKQLMAYFLWDWFDGGLFDGW